MDKETAHKLHGVVVARAGLRDRPKEWSAEDLRRFEFELANMPGEFREYYHWKNFITNPKNIEIAESYGMDVETFFRLTVVGNDEYMRHLGSPESDLARPHPNIPGNTFGVAIVSTEITPS